MGHRVALALERYLEAALRQGSSRHFYRIEGFDEDTYRYLLALLSEKHDTLAGRPLWIRTVAPVALTERYQVEEKKSATWYRNHVPDTHALVLIFNARTSDAQSLKDIHPITEQVLSRQTALLTEATFSNYQLSRAEVATLDTFVKRLPQIGVPQPQLRDLVSFYAAVDTFLTENPDKGLPHAVAHCLPELSLFRARAYAEDLNASKGDKLLKLIHRSSLIGSNPLDSSELNRYLARLEDASFEDHTPYGGFSPAEKRELLTRFLSEVMDNRNDLAQVYRLDWQEVSPILHKPRKPPQPQRFKDLASDLRDVMAAENIIDLSDNAEEALTALARGERPNDAGADDLYEELKEHLPKTVAKPLNRLRQVTKRDTDEFIGGLMALLVDLLDLHQEPGVPLSVRLAFEDTSVPNKVKNEEKSSVLKEAVETFHCLYHGVEAYLSEVQWDIGGLWELLTADGADVTEKERKASLVFKVELVNAQGEGLAAAQLIWHHRSDSTFALTTAHVRAERGRLKDETSLPIYNTVRAVQHNVIIDITQPFETLGTWYERPADVRNRLEAVLKPKTLPHIWRRLSEQLSALETGWRTYVLKAAEDGLLGADIRALLGTYETFLGEATATLATDVEASNGFSVLTQAWLIGDESFDEWAIVPLLHPLKLHWYGERLGVFNGFIETLRSGESDDLIADVAEFKRSLGTLYGSSGYPTLLALQKSDLTADYLLPVVEIHGYELYRPRQLAGLAFGLTDDLVTSGEGAAAAKVASKELTKVLTDYLKTFPFARDGFDIYLFKCRNSALPGLLIEALAKVENRLPRVNVVVHVENSGAPAYREVLRWLDEHENFKERAADAYFPAATLRVLECKVDAFFEYVTDYDLVILADVLAEQGQTVEAVIQESDGTRHPFEGHFQTHGAALDPHSRGQQTREIVLNDTSEPSMLQAFYKGQWITKERKALRPKQRVLFKKHVTLQTWAKPLSDLHKSFNWVTCYDTTVDRFLLKTTIPESVEVIRYSVGLGAKRRHNLTVSSSDRAQQTVTHRLSARLDGMVGMPHTYRQKLARRLVGETKSISGDLVLRAAGPGAFLNELIGVVAAKRVTEQGHRDESLLSWVYLDDFAHWFSRKYPDLLFFALRLSPDDVLSIKLQVLEAKCVDEGGFQAESLDARRQVVEGVSRLKRVWAPGGRHLDASYWYDQLYQALVSNLSFAEQRRVPWDVVRHKLLTGDYCLDVTGEAWVFCYSGVPTSVPAGRGEDHGTFRAESLPDTTLNFHHYSRAGLLRILEAMVDAQEATQARPSPLESLPELVARPTTASPPEEVKSPRVQQQATVPVEGVTSALPEETVAQEADLEQGSGDAAPSEAEEVGPPIWLLEQANDLETAIKDYGVDIYPIDVNQADIGPNVVRYKVMLRPGERLTKLQGIAPDLVHRLALTSTPIIDNVLGTQYVGIDMANPEPQVIQLLPLLQRLAAPGPGELPFILGQAPDGRLLIDDLSEFPHLLVAGATNSGKSVFLRSLIVSFMTQYRPEQLRLLVIDPKRTDFSFFEDLPYLTDNKVVTDREEARERLLDLVHTEMPKRQRVMQGRSMKIKDFNKRFPDEALPVIVAVIDEYAQLLSIMSTRESKAFEQDLMSLAAVARATGIHLVLATQRPSADVVTGTLKANLPASVAFKVASSTNSRIVLDQNGAENLLGYGDMLFKRPSGEVIRLQAPFIDEVELMNLIQTLR